MRYALPLMLLATLHAADSIDVLIPGVSHHPNWDEEGEPNPWNYGLGGSWTYQHGDPLDWGQVQLGGMAYKDSFGELGGVAFAGLGIRSPTVISVEGLFGLGYWSGSGTAGLCPIWYVGVGYQRKEFSVFIDGTASSDVTAAWLKLVFPLNR
jgi:hypothetical protein